MTDPTAHVSPRRALVAGGTGLVGGELLRLLGASARYRQVTSLARRAIAGPPGVTVQQADFDRLDEERVSAADDAFCCLGTTRRVAGSDEAFRRVDLDYVVAFARLAQRAGARRFLLVSSLGASARSSLLYPRTKGEGEDAIRAMGFEAVVILRPSILDGARAAKREGEGMALAIGRAIKPLLIGPLRKYAPVESSVVARNLVSLAETAPAGVTIVESDAIR